MFHRNFGLLPTDRVVMKNCSFETSLVLHRTRYLWRIIYPKRRLTINEPGVYGELFLRNIGSLPTDQVVNKSCSSKRPSTIEGGTRRYVCVLQLVCTRNSPMQRRGIVAPHILNLDIRFTQILFNSFRMGKSTRNAMHRRPGGPQSRSGGRGQDRNLLPLSPWPKSRHYTYWAILEPVSTMTNNQSDDTNKLQWNLY
jgi:hypothetical protein